jgi:hypothetical protein
LSHADSEFDGFGSRVDPNDCAGLFYYTCKHGRKSCWFGLANGKKKPLQGRY